MPALCFAFLRRFVACSVPWLYSSTGIRHPPILIPLYSNMNANTPRESQACLGLSERSKCGASPSRPSPCGPTPKRGQRKWFWLWWAQDQVLLDSSGSGTSQHHQGIPCWSVTCTLPRPYLNTNTSALGLGQAEQILSECSVEIPAASTRWAARQAQTDRPKWAWPGGHGIQGAWNKSRSARYQLFGDNLARYHASVIHPRSISTYVCIILVASAHVLVFPVTWQPP